VLVDVLVDLKLPPHPVAYEAPTSNRIKPRNRKKFFRGDFLLPTHPIRASSGTPRNAAMEIVLDRCSCAAVAPAVEMLTATVVTPPEMTGTPPLGI
jgi:hypothetical protein